MRLPQLTFGRVLGGTAVLLVLTTGAAYAHGPVTSADIVNGTIRSVDIGSGEVKGGDIGNGTIRSADIFNGGVKSADVLDDSLTAADLANSSVGQLEIATDGVAATEIQDNSIDSGEIVDFGLTNEDVGVLEAQVNANGSLASSDHVGTTSSSLGTGTYEVDFARSVANCTPVVTQGEAGVGGAGGAITGVTDRSGNVEAFFVTMRNTAGALVNTAFHIVVVC